MQVIHNFAVKPQEYFLKGKDNDFLVIEKCLSNKSISGKSLM